MPHADSSLVPETIQTKPEFWSHVYMQLESLLEGQRNWVSNLANSSSLIYSALLSFPAHFGSSDKAVNWCGFYIDSRLFPQSVNAPRGNNNVNSHADRLLLGPFCGKPACQYIQVTPGKSRGVCASAFLERRTMLVTDVESFPGHIACDGDTKSEIVCPLILNQSGEDRDVAIPLGVLDLDCLALRGFDDDDRAGLERLAALIIRSCDW